MPFKLYSDSQVDQPRISCDVCSGPIIDIWGDKASATPSHDGQTSDVIVHHAGCQAQGAVTIPLIEFLRLFAVQNRIGDIGSDGQTDIAHVPYPSGKGFQK